MRFRGTTEKPSKGADFSAPTQYIFAPRKNKSAPKDKERRKGGQSPLGARKIRSYWYCNRYKSNDYRERTRKEELIRQNIAIAIVEKLTVWEHQIFSSFWGTNNNFPNYSNHNEGERSNGGEGGEG